MTPDDAWLGLADPDTVELERPSASTDWPRHPYVTLEGESLAFWWARVAKVEDGYRATLAADGTQSGPGMLERFASLGRAGDEAILAYARRWGALELCSHNLPRAHPPTPRMPRTTYFCEDRYGDAEMKPLGHLEPLWVWRAMSRRCASILTLAAGLWTEPPSIGQPVTWALMGRDMPTDTAGARRVLAAEVNLWIQLAQVRPWAAVSAPFVRIGGHDLVGALAVQLLLATSRSHGWAICSSCGRPYAPSRRPATGRVNYCSNCREAGIANRTAAQQYRLRKRTQREGSGS